MTPSVVMMRMLQVRDVQYTVQHTALVASHLHLLLLPMGGSTLMLQARRESIKSTPGTWHLSRQAIISANPEETYRI